MGATTPLLRVPREALPERYGQAWETLDRLTGEPSFVEVFAGAPHLLDFVMHDFYAKLFFGGVVDERYKQLARLRLSLVHGCRTCNLQNVPGALAAGFTVAQIDAMEDYERGPFSDAEKAVLRYADQIVLTNMEGDLDPTLHAVLRQHFTDAQICELGTVKAVIAGLAKLAFVLRLVEREPYCAFGPEARAAPSAAGRR
jgi:alkylhydroperoxidase family enzyme